MTKTATTVLKRISAFASPVLWQGFSRNILAKLDAEVRAGGRQAPAVATAEDMNPSDGQPPTPHADQQLDLLTPGGGTEFLCIACIVREISSGCMAMEECNVCLTTIWRRFYRAKLEQLRSADSAIWTRAKERSWSSTASKKTRDFVLRVLEYLFRAMYEKNQCDLEQYTGGLFASADLDQPDLDYAADVNTMVQGCVERSTRVACKRFLQVVWKRLMLGYALQRVVEVWTRQVKKAVLDSGMHVEDVHAAARKIELCTLNKKWCHDALEMFRSNFEHDMDHIPESIVNDLLVEAPRLWTDKSRLSSFEQSSLSFIMDAVNERQSRDDFISETCVVARGMGIDLVLLDGEAHSLASTGQDIKIEMARYHPGSVKCHAKICADGAWKAELVRAYKDKIADEFKMKDAVRTLAALSTGFVPQVLSSRDCSFSSPAA